MGMTGLTGQRPHRNDDRHEVDPPIADLWWIIAVACMKSETHDGCRAR